MEQVTHARLDRIEEELRDLRDLADRVKARLEEIETARRVALSSARLFVELLSNPQSFGSVESREDDPDKET